MGHSYVKNFFHIVWATKKRTPYITKPIKNRLYGYTKHLVQKKSVCLLAIGGMHDHIHMLIQAGSSFQLSSFMGAIKSRSSKFVNTINGEEDYFDLHGYRNGGRPNLFAWQEGYHSCTVTPSVVKKTTRYINNQEEHHKKLLYEEEIKLLLQLDLEDEI